MGIVIIWVKSLVVHSLAAHGSSQFFPAQIDSALVHAGGPKVVKKRLPYRVKGPIDHARPQ